MNKQGIYSAAAAVMILLFCTGAAFAENISQLDVLHRELAPWVSACAAISDAAYTQKRLAQLRERMQTSERRNWTHLMSQAREFGTRHTALLLEQLAACGLNVNEVQARILERLLEQDVRTHRCVPPNRQILDTVQKDARHKIRLSKLTSRSDQDDFAYFAASVGNSFETQREVKQENEHARPINNGVSLQSLKRKGLWKDVITTLTGEASAVRAEPLRLLEVEINLARVLELTQRYSQASDVYHDIFVSDPDSLDIMNRAAEGLIRVSEAQRICASMVAARMFSPPAGEHYGVNRLRDVGYNVASLYRGAIVASELELSWHVVTNAVEGLAAYEGIASTQLLLKLLDHHRRQVRETALNTLGALYREPVFDPCLPTCFSMQERGAVDEGRFITRTVRSLNSLHLMCSEAAQTKKEKARVVRSIIQTLSDKHADDDLRLRAIEVLGLMADRSALPVLKKLLLQRAYQNNRADEGCLSSGALSQRAREAMWQTEYVQFNRKFQKQRCQ